MIDLLPFVLSAVLSALGGFGVSRYQMGMKQRSERHTAAIQQPAEDARVAIDGFTMLVEQLQEEVRDCKDKHEQSAVREVALTKQVFELQLEVMDLRRTLEHRNEEG